MRKIFLYIALLFLCSQTANSQTILDTTFNGWKAKVWLPPNWDGNDDSSFHCIIFSYGSGQAGTAPYTDLDNYGPMAYLLGGWNGGINLVYGRYYAVLIGLQQNPAFSYQGEFQAKCNSIKARYKIKASNLHTSGWSAGSHMFKSHVIEDGTGGSAPFTYASGFKSMVDLQGVVPNEDATWYDKVRNFALNGVTGGGEYLGIWGTADGDRSIPRFADSMNAARSGSAVVISNSDGHNSAAVDRIFGSLAGAAPANLTIGGASMNVYQWMLRQGDTTFAVPGTASAGADTTVYINQTRPDSVYLNGSASTGGTVYIWTLVSGTNTPTIIDQYAQSTWVTGLVEGSYTFRLTVDGVSTDDVNVFVRDWMKKGQRPCRSGAKQSFTLTQSGGEVYRPYITRDNVLPSMLGGDTIYIQGGTFTAGVELGDFGGSEGCPIVIAAKDIPVTITSGGFFRLGARDSNMVSYVKVDGTTLRSAGYPFGFISTHTTYNAEGFTANNVHHIEVAGVSVNKKAVGILLKKNSTIYPFSQFDKMILRNVKIHDNYIRNVEGEGLYIGHTDNTGTQPGNSSGYGPPPRGDSIEVYNNVVDSTGWDGIQISNFLNNVKVYGNVVYRAGQTNASSQQHGIIVGSNIISPQIYDNLVMNVTGGGVSVFSYGSASITHNVLDSVAKSGTGVEKAIYVKRNTVIPETITPLIPTISNNIITGAENAAIYTDYPPETAGGTISGNWYFGNGTNGIQNNSAATTASNNTLSSFSLTIDNLAQTSTGYTMTVTHYGASQTFTNITDAVDWIYSRTSGILPPTLLKNKYKKFKRVN